MANQSALKRNVGPKNGNSDGVEQINPALERWIVPIDQLKPDPRNPRTHPAKNLGAIKNSLATFKQQTPIVVTKDKIVIKGNGTYEAAKALGWKRIAAIPTDLVQKRLVSGYKIADNKTGDLADWDFELLGETIKEFDDLDWKGLGWEDWELGPILEADWTPPRIEEGDGIPGMTTIKVTAAQKEVIGRAIQACRERTDDGEMTEGRALELICADWLSG